MSETETGTGRSNQPSLEDSELRYRRLFEAAQDGILILDARTGAIMDVNPFLIDLLGYSREEFLAKKLWEVGAFRDIEASREAFRALQEREYIRYKDLPLRTKDGQLVQVEFVSNVYLAGSEKVIQCNIRDITERKEAQDALLRSEALYREQSVRDPLTGLYNRRYMEETLYRELRRALRRQSSVAIIMLDVDNLKHINDTLGHPAGDAALRELAGLLRENVRHEDVASRYGGDEFILILPDMSKEVARQRAELVCRAAGAQKLQFEEQKATALRISAGVASFPENGLTPAAVLQAADAALYRAKQQARGTAVAAE
jgi:diguanylate cyclase (GGDEF)-like protein/PAS domain S-box-containing protein